MHDRRRKLGLSLLAGVLAVGLVALVWATAIGSSEAQQGVMQNCPQPSKWAISVWNGDDATDVDDAFATCDEGGVALAYSIDPDTQQWSRWFASRPELNTLTAVDDMQGVLALGGARTVPTQVPTPTVFTGQDDKSTPVFEVTYSPFQIAWTTQSDSPMYAMFGFFVYPQGETTVFECMAFYDGEGSDYTICRAPPGRYWLEVLAANLTSWQIEVGPAPPTSSLPVTFTGKGDKDTPTFHASGSNFIVAWTVESYSPKDASFAVFVFPEGERLIESCEFEHDGIGSASGLCDAGPGDYYLATVAANLTSWKVDITEP
jgi:hypothetical protein